MGHRHERPGKGGEVLQLRQKELSDLVKRPSSDYRGEEGDVAQQLRNETEDAHSRRVVAAPPRLGDVHAGIGEVATAGEDGGMDDEGPRRIRKRWL